MASCVYWCSFSNMAACDCELSGIAPSVVDACSGSQYVAFMSLVDVIIRRVCAISDPCGRVRPKRQPEYEYDFIVIGGGSGGSTAAGRLAEVNGWKTLLLEAGIDEPPATQIPAFPTFSNTVIDWNYTTEAEANACLNNDGICTWPRGKVLGGCSVFHGMMYMRGTPADYQKWVDAGNTDWSYDKLLPVFMKSENNRQIGSLVSSKYHGYDGPFTIQRFNDQPELAWDLLTAAKETGFPVSDDLNGEEYVGFTIAQANNRDGARLSTAKAFVRPHRDSSNLDVMLNSTVTRILVSEVNGEKRATGVEFIYNNETYVVNVTKEVILAGGAVNTPQILLLSGIGDQAVLNEVGIEQVHNLPAVGKGIKNHVSFAIAVRINRPDYVDLNWDTLTRYIESEDGPLSSTGMSQLTARISSNYTASNDPDIQLFFSGYVNTCAYSGDPESPVDKDDPDGQRTIFISSVNLHPKSSGSITLRSSDPLAKPKIVGNYLTDPADIKVVLNGIRQAQRLIQSPTLISKYNATLLHYSYGDCGSTYEFDTDEFWECAIKYETYPENHQASSCKIGLESDENTCANQQLQLHGIPNIRLADASVMVEPPSGNTEATIVAIAERAVLYIREKYLGEAAF